MPRMLKLVFHVEDEDKNVIVEKSQISIAISDETLAKADHLSVDDLSETLEGMREWGKPYRDIMDQMDSADIMMKRHARKVIIDWAKAQRK